MTPDAVAQALAAHHLWAVAASVGLAWAAALLLRWTARAGAQAPRGSAALLWLLSWLLLWLCGLLAWAALLRPALAGGPTDASAHAPLTAWLLRLDMALLQALPGQLSPAALQAWSLFTHAGDSALLTVLSVVVAWLLWRQRARLLLATWLLGVAGNAVLIRATKATVERVRPLPGHDWPVVISGSSFPSGHAAAATVVWGLCAWLVACCLPQRWHASALLAAVLLAVGVGWSRVLLQVHHASDVLAGWLGGVLWLGLCIGAATWLQQRQARRAGQT